MLLDPTEEDVLLAVWQYILNKNLLLETREKKFIKSDEVRLLHSLFVNALQNT